MNRHSYSPAATQPGFQPVLPLVVPLAVWQQMMAYIQACPVEINGFGYIDRIGDLLYLSEVFILEQTATAASVEVSPEVLGRHLYEMTRSGTDTGRMRFQWHSHVNMEAYFSGTDTGNIESYSQSDWMVSLVGNKRGEYQARLDVFRPFRVWTPVPVLVDVRADPQLLAASRREVQRKVRQPGFFRDRGMQPTSGDAGASLVPASVVALGEQS